MLWSAGLAEPQRVFAHGWITIDGEKMSKSVGNVIDPFALVDQFGADAVRYFLFREAPFGSDFSISIEKLRLRYNADLGNDFGNLLRRSLAMLAKYRNGLVPAATESSIGERFSEIGAQVHEHIMALRFREALDTIWELITALNREIDDRKPWDLNKKGLDVELDAMLYDLCEGLRFIALLLFPFMPVKATAVWHQLGLPGKPDGNWQEQLRWGSLAANTQTNPGDALFPRIDAPAAAAAG
jgi:methionyl-tRNA synthetase